MERKELQALCKKHKSNLEMAKRLAEVLKEKEKSPIQGLLNVFDEIANETGFTNMKRKDLQACCARSTIFRLIYLWSWKKRLSEFFKEKEKSPIQGLLNVFDEIANETDFTNMKRKDLQACCARSTIFRLIYLWSWKKRLSEFFKEIEKSSIQWLINEQDKNEAMTRKVKKVRFRPSNLSVETVDNNINSRENVDGQGRVMRSRGLKLTEGHVNGTKRGIMFHTMKRRELQALCQKHNIPANLSNLEMAKRLAEFFMEKEKSPIQGAMNVMDFDSMKRKDLQALCRKHNIPANLSNLEMTKRLSEFSKENENPSIEGLINEQDENVAMTRKVKKVRFSPKHEVFEFARSPDLKRKSSRNSVSVRPVDRARQSVGPVGRPKRIVKPARLL